jgi:2-methylcitrate dehydratase PrpD
VDHLAAEITSHATRRALLKGALAAGSLGGVMAFAQEPPREGKNESGSPPLALALARLFSRTKFADFSPVAIKHAKIILASTLASAAPGSRIGSVRIVRDLAKEQGGQPDSTIWYDGTKLPVTEAARVNAMLSDAAASDDSDLRNVAHTGTSLAAIGLALGERTGVTGPDVLSAIVTGYEAAGRMGEALNNGRAGLHASIIVAFGGVVAAAKLLKLTSEQMAHAISMTSTSMGGLLIGTDSWAREYHAGNAALCAVNAALAAGRGYTVNADLLEAKGGFLEVFGKGQWDAKRVTRPLGPDWDIVKYMAVKLVPGAHALHSSAEAAANASRQANVQPDEIAKMLVSGPSKTSVQYGSRPPKDMIEAIHSLAYFVASAVADKDFNWSNVTPEKIHSPVVARLIGLVEPDPAPPAVHYDWNWGGTVTIVTKSGARFTSTVDAPKGSGPRGIEWSDVDAKYHALMPDSGLPAKRVEEILKMIHDFDQVKQVSQFTRLLH